MTSIKSISLHWSDFIRISNLKYDNQYEAGVYVWGFTIGKDFIPYYIGIADNLILRIHEHINSIIGGRYTIYHSSSLAEFKNYKDHEAGSIGKIYHPDWPYGYKYFIENRKNMQPHIDFMVDSFTFSFASIERQNGYWDDLKNIEKICINQIGKENLANTRAGICESLCITHKGNEFLVSKFKATNR